MKRTSAWVGAVSVAIAVNYLLGSVIGGVIEDMGWRSTLQRILIGQSVLATLSIGLAVYWLHLNYDAAAAETAIVSLLFPVFAFLPLTINMVTNPPVGKVPGAPSEYLSNMMNFGVFLAFSLVSGIVVHLLLARKVQQQPHIHEPGKRV